MRMIDFHTHILPLMDDGSKDINTSLEMLNKLENDGVKTVCLTSHYHSEYENIDDYIKRRDEAYNKLNYQGNIELKKGAEIRYYTGMSHDKDLYKLCLEGTNMLLIEFPLMLKVDQDMINEIIKIKINGFDVCLAHIERYGIKESKLEYLHNSGIKFQMNTGFIMSFLTKKKAFSLIKKHYISYLGSDCHNVSTRPPLFKTAVDKIEKEIGDVSSFIDRLYNLE